ncbi:hypothetical protein M3O40_10345, partial [Xanthomonas nasturtii]|nr:hypothetical protein [Xanthomonas nasturtii]MCL1503521.1 hypothetical protein [Xanthomonas nasturtii]MCL1523533.1 hypothetical protein [Xanthomonas nasturtii]
AVPARRKCGGRPAMDVVWGFFRGDYFDADKVSDGGGVEEDGEEIEVLELSLDAALAMIATGEIAAAKTIMLLQYAKLHDVLG